MILSCAGLTQTASAQMAAAASAPRPYLTADQLPDVRAYLAPPPQPGSPAHAADVAAYEASLAGKDGAAWRGAVSQLSVRSPAMQRQILCAVGARLDPTPASAFGRLMARTAATLGVASESSKRVWNRPRPYAGQSAAVACDPELDFGVHSPSYPSGHAALGWLWGSVLAQVAPERATPALAWGASIGSNRIACRVHYPSDVAAGQQLGAALFARLQGEPAFRADVEAARAELAAARKAGAPADCATE